MFQPVDREAAEIAVEEPEMVEHAVGQPLREGTVFAADDRPVVGCALFHFAELGASRSRFVDSFLHAHRVSPSLRLSLTV